MSYFRYKVNTFSLKRAKARPTIAYRPPIALSHNPMIGAQRRQSGQLFATTTTHVVSGRVAAPLLNPATMKDQP
ncbi:hypothetical protein GCWU000325_02368 [Alloprevotella tannerae ATCC 51259]|uniref:Uncharacterized protein n=1 Tax=Alloprevotella tannerae ATCC 51259 TaxID=626522 RepID=C9LJF6_9BACT|nr:hypothetical protein GCWU000325_02368 [Alloprevotella tannerae ATCC 51259]